MIRKAPAVDQGGFWPHAGASLRSAVAAPARGLARVVDSLASVNLSVRAKILVSLGFVIALMGAVNVIVLLQWFSYSRQYDAIINNITAANSISGHLKSDIDTEMWKVVSGKVGFRDGKQYEVIRDARAQLATMIGNTDSHRAQVKLDIIGRTLGSLTEEIDQMGRRIEQGSTAAENETQLERIRFASTVLEEVVQDYALFEVHRTEEQYQQMRQSFARWQVWYALLLFGAVGFSVLAAWGISRSIYVPIKKLHDVTTVITKNDLQALVTRDNVDEIEELGMSFNIMIGKIRDLVDAKLKEHEQLKKAELRALQAQINPHFLYNTLDTIIWMAEANRNTDVIEVVRALSSFFRLSLSKGRDWITIGEELERTRSYLTIQKMRYADILDYRIEADEAVLDNTVLKLSLQPLVENALYHGIKNKRGGGTITVRATQGAPDEVLLQVEDNGIGFTPERLALVQAGLEDESDEIKLERGFGIDNVNKRTRLYYGKGIRPVDHQRTPVRYLRVSGDSREAERVIAGGWEVSGMRPDLYHKDTRNQRFTKLVASYIGLGEPLVLGFFVVTLLLPLAIAVAVLAGCGSPPQPAAAQPAAATVKPKKTYQDLIIGYAQLGAESEWRSANTRSVKETAERLGVELKFSDAQQKQDNQIRAIRSFIAQKVDVIGVPPIVETGWDEVFAEAKQAGIPIILVDRRAQVPEDAYVTYLGSDFMEEGRNAARVMATITSGKAHIVELVGTVGSAPANDRYKGFREILADYPEMQILDSRSADFTLAKGREVMTEFLRQYGNTITALYAHNDDMALGAIQAIEAYGLRPGVDIKIVSVDAARSAFEAMIAGKLNATVECNPLLGPQFFDLALKVVNGEPVPKWVPSQEGIFYPENAAQILPSRQY